MKKFAILMAFFVFAGFQLLLAQTVQISGTVTSSEDGLSVPGASIVVRGTTIGTVTDFEGNYTLDVPADAQFLVFSFVGYVTQEVAIGGRTVINVQMVPDIMALEEIVVTALGVSRERKALGYSVQAVSSESVSRANTDDVVKALSAKTAGVSITSSSGSAGAAAYITIRGSASVTGNNQPLFIVDGQPIVSGGGGTGVDGVQTSGRSIDLNPEDIESVSVLKGGAATALYGVRAANGVIIITTKKGKAGQMLDVQVNSSVQLSQVSQLPAFQEKFAQGVNGVWATANASSWGPRLDQSAYSKDPSVWTRPLYDTRGAIVPATSPLADASLGSVLPADRYEFFQTGLTYNNNVSVSSSNPNSQFFLSIGNRDEASVIPNEKFGRTSIRANASTKLLDNLKVGANSNFVNSNGNFVQKGSNISGIMLGLLRTATTFFNEDGYELPGGAQRNYRGGGGYDNPYWVVNKIFWTEATNRFIGNTFVEYNALDWLTFKYTVGIDWYNRRWKDEFSVGSRAFPGGRVTEGFNYTGLFNSDFLALINKNISDDISLTGTLGHNLYSSFSKTLTGATNAPLEIPGFNHLSNTSLQATGVGEAEFRSSAVFADVTVALYNMLYVGGTGRYEKATSMPDGKGEFFPSASLAFVFTELPGLAGNDILSFGKVRASYAQIANVAPAYALSTQWFSGGVGDGWTDGGGFPMLGVSGFTYGNTGGAPNLTHEKMRSFEVGTELRFLNNRIGLDFTYFDNYNEALILNVPISPSTGFFGQFMNAAEMSSKGIEVTFNATPVRTKDFKWDIIANFTKIDNVVEKLAPGINDVFLAGFVDPQIRAVAGQPYRSIYGFDWYRDDNGNVLINTDPSRGRVGYPLTNAAQGMIPLGKVDPDYTANIMNELSYKGISVSVLMDIRKGGLVWNGTRMAMNFFGTSKETENREVFYNPDGSIDLTRTPAENIVVWNGVLGYLDANGNVVTDGTANNIPVVLDQQWYQGFGSNFGGGPTIPALEKTDWFRIREVTLTYSFPKSLLAATPIKNLDIYASGYNLLLITPYNGIDPETNLQGAVNGQGMDYFNNPGKKMYTFGVRMGF
jgi:TonB-linked SusC/RagA family outer membrane protein